MTRITNEQYAELRESHPHVIEELNELRDISARLWNALVWYSGSRKKFTGRLVGLAITLRDRAKDGHPEGYTTQMDHEVERMIRDGWANCERH